MYTRITVDGSQISECSFFDDSSLFLFVESFLGIVFVPWKVFYVEQLSDYSNLSAQEHGLIDFLSKPSAFT